MHCQCNNCGSLISEEEPPIKAKEGNFCCLDCLVEFRFTEAVKIRTWGDSIPQHEDGEIL